ncbi:hypothetical protein [uncultured Candidatus Kuenenia sp.]|uniref:hypothetical protein n=1 Tax=uncultured Candidatus Kuenenia sp. TaxID=1048336 RepID=UPI0002DE21D8|nr:hypothetical protein [uncultured Candidatus Kuenenia sp.]
MSSNFQSIKNLPKDVVINLIVTLLVSALISAIPWLLSGKLRLSILTFGLLFVFAIYLLYLKYKRLFKLIKSGLNGYYYTFDISENKKVFDEAQKSFFYLGISSNSIIELFRKWADKDRSVDRYLFLLTDPESSALKRQVAYEKGISLESDMSLLNSQLSLLIEQDVAVERERIYSAIDLLKTLPPFKNGKIAIRLHKEFIPWWMYIIDERKIYLGILERGKRGQDSPALVISKNPDFPSLFDPFKNNWDRIWADARGI